MYVVRVGMHQTDRDGLIPAIGDPACQCLRLAFVQRQQHSAICGNALRQGEPMLPRDQGRWQFEVQVILLETVFRPHLDHVAKAFGRDKRRLRAAPLDQGVGHKRRAVDDLCDV
jgi:hypothetical protein